MTLGTSRIRRSPNAFNLVHQLEFLARNGLSDTECVKTLEVRGDMTVHGASDLEDIGRYDKIRWLLNQQISEIHAYE